MIAFKKLVATGTGLNTFDERHLGGSGGQPDWQGIIIDATDAAVSIRLPLVRLCEGKVITFTTINPNSRNISIATPAGSGEVIIISSTSASAINNSNDFGYVMLFCNGTRWHALGDGSFT